MYVSCEVLLLDPHITHRHAKDAPVTSGLNNMWRSHFTIELTSIKYLDTNLEAKFGESQVKWAAKWHEVG